MVARPESPTVDRPLQPVTVTEGETAKFMVKMRGEPPPSVTWYINDVAVYNVSQASHLHYHHRRAVSSDCHFWTR